MFGALPAFAARLPQLCLPNFDGDPLEWPAFWQCFESAVDRLPLEPVDKLNYLHGCLRGRAARAVTSYRGGENYAHAVAALKRLFGDPWKIAEALQAELMNLRPVDDDVRSLQDFLETLERVCRQLSNLEMPDDSPFITGLAEVISIREEVERCLREAKPEGLLQLMHEQRPNRPQRHERSEHARVFSAAQSSKNQVDRRVPSCYSAIGGQFTFRRLLILSDSLPPIIPPPSTFSHNPFKQEQRTIWRKPKDDTLAILLPPCPIALAIHWFCLPTALRFVVQLGLPSFVDTPPPSAFTLAGASLSRHALVNAVTSKSAARPSPSAVPSPVRSARRQSTPSPPRRPPSVSPRRPAVPPSSVGPPPPKKRFSSGQLCTLLCQKIGQYAIEQKALVGWTEQRKREIGEALDQALLALREAVLDGIDVSVHLTNRQAVQLRSLRRALLSTDADEDDDAVSIVSASSAGNSINAGNVDTEVDGKN
ncbi:hypothetical protein niasHT_027265 [Heterodera trifolii]|uniref:Uncharacterized protein n=1 Tax=Heterodera trifolii TaxID=157864 RepID=A0ABD2JTL3_9BILA